MSRRRKRKRESEKERKRERKTERETERETESERVRVRVRVSVCVCERLAPGGECCCTKSEIAPGQPIRSLLLNEVYVGPSLSFLAAKDLPRVTRSSTIVRKLLAQRQRAH